MANTPDVANKQEIVDAQASVGDSDASDSAYVTISTEAVGASIRFAVPPKDSARLLDTLALFFCVAGLVAAPYLMVKALGGLDVTMPWPADAGLVLLCLVVPLCTIAFLRHRHR